MSAKAATKTEADTAAGQPPHCPAVPDLADDIAHMLRHGRMWGPKRIKRMIFIDEDGERTSIVLPLLLRVEPDDEPGEQLTDMEAAVLEVIDGVSVGTVISTDEIARRSGFSNTDEMRKFLQLLAKSNRIRRVRYGYERVS